MSDRGQLVVIVGPSGVGKGTVISALRQRCPDIWVSISATTREPRRGERDGVDYHFVTRDQFHSLVAKGEMLEWAVVHETDYYGTPSAPAYDMMAQGKCVILEIDVQGARQVVANAPEAVTVFIAPPSEEELVARLKKRGTETDVQVARRLRTARAEMAAQDEFDHVLTNREVAATVDELVDLLGLTTINEGQP